MTGKSEVSFPVAEHPEVDQLGQFICVCKLKYSIDLSGDSLCSRSPLVSGESDDIQWIELPPVGPLS